MSRRSRDEQFDGQVVSDVATRDGLIGQAVGAGPGERTERTRVTVARPVQEVIAVIRTETRTPGSSTPSLAT